MLGWWFKWSMFQFSTTSLNLSKPQFFSLLRILDAVLCPHWRSGTADSMSSNLGNVFIRLFWTEMTKKMIWKPLLPEEITKWEIKSESSENKRRQIERNRSSCDFLHLIRLFVGSFWNSFTLSVSFGSPIDYLIPDHIIQEIHLRLEKPWEFAQKDEQNVASLGLKTKASLWIFPRKTSLGSFGPNLMFVPDDIIYPSHDAEAIDC